MMTAPSPPFPCPFCQSSRVDLVGGGLVFLHYKCGQCAEVWTAMAAPRPKLLHPRSTTTQEVRKTRVEWSDDDFEPSADPGGHTPVRGGRLLPKQKFWRH
jgi:hypothetical protein